MAGYDALYPNISPAHPFIVVPNCLDSRIPVDGNSPFSASVPVKTYRQASCPSITVPPGEGSSQTLVGSGFLCRRRPDNRRAHWHVDEVVSERKGPMGIRDILSIGGEEDVESTSSTRVLGVDRNHQRRRMEPTVGTLEEIPSKGNWKPRNSPATCCALHTYGGPATCLE